MALKSATKKVKKFSPIQEKNYLKRKSISEQMKKLEKRVDDLKEDRHKLDAKLGPVFEQNHNQLKLSDGTVVRRTVVDVDDQIGTKAMVGKVIKSGYSFPKYNEIAGEE
jgi:hypothetical protein